MTEKIKVQDTICDIGIDDITGPIENIIQKLTIKKTEAEIRGFTDIEVQEENWSDYTNFYLRGMRLETDVEFEIRIKKEEKNKKLSNIQKLKAKERELKTLDRLIKKHGIPLGMNI